MNDRDFEPFAAAQRLEAPVTSQLDPGTQFELSAHLRQLKLLIEEIQNDADRQGAHRIPVVLEGYRTRVYHALAALGDWINEFLAAQPPLSDVLAVRLQVVTPIREWSRTSPLLQHSLGKPRGKGSDPDLVQRLLDNRPAGADIPALVLNDFYKHSVGGSPILGG